MYLPQLLVKQKLTMMVNRYEISETDAAGNPLIDFAATNVVCADPACPAHMPVTDGTRRVDNDVRGWGSVWFYSNPIFIRPSTSPPLLIETNANQARALAGLPPL